MKKKFAVTALLVLVFSAYSLNAQEQVQPRKRNCKTRAEIRHTHRLEYRAPNGTFRGCQVKAEFYFQIKKANRGSPKKNQDICEEGFPRYTPRIGKSYEICP
ncbi:MAG: hypothetical protein GY866_17005 [Proteobacteria bacterium]|nr:hypothetical protein [Pseudomonadota bacterium]